jgi:hypothetical protein
MCSKLVYEGGKGSLGGDRGTIAGGSVPLGGRESSESRFTHLLHRSSFGPFVGPAFSCDAAGGQGTGCQAGGAGHRA